MASVLTIGGSTVNRADNAIRAILNRLTISVDAPDQLEFAQVGASLRGAWHPGQAVTLTVDGTLRFTGEINRRMPRKGSDGWTIGYVAMGLKWLANRIPITNSQNGTGTIVYNLPSTDPNYVQSQSGQTVGQILAAVFTAHASALSAVGITGYNSSDLTPLTIVPDEPVYLQGSRFWNTIEDFLQQWYPQYAACIPANGTIRVLDTTAFTPTTITLDDDTNPWIIEDITEDTSDCYTRVVLRGYAEIEPAYLSLVDGSLTEAFTSTDKSNWTWASFTSPLNAADSGTITLLTSTQATVQSSSGSTSWGVNYWPPLEAWIQLVNPVAVNIGFTEFRFITANTALSPGGTSVITLDTPLANSGYTTYHIVGQPAGVSDCWRLYNIVPTYVAQHLVAKFPRSVAWSPNSSEVVQTNYPAAQILKSGTGVPATFELMPATGQIRFAQPTVRSFGTLSNLELGGSHTDGIPDDIKVLVPYSRGVLEAIYPPNSPTPTPTYAGTAYSDFGIQRTLYRDYPNWVFGNDASSYQALAQQILITVQNTVVEGSLRYEGKYSAGLTLGMAVNIAGNGYTTGWESLAAPVRTFTLEWPQSGAATPWVSTLQFSTRRRPYSGDKLYEHPMFTGGQYMWDGGFHVDQASAMGGLANTFSTNVMGQLGSSIDAEGLSGDSVLGAMAGGRADVDSTAAQNASAGMGGPVSIPTSFQDLGADPTGGFFNE